MIKKDFLTELNKLPSSSNVFEVIFEIEKVNKDKALNIFEEILPLRIVPSKEVVFLVKNEISIE